MAHFSILFSLIPPTVGFPNSYGILRLTPSDVARTATDHPRRTPPRLPNRRKRANVPPRQRPSGEFELKSARSSPRQRRAAGSIIIFGGPIEMVCAGAFASAAASSRTSRRFRNFSCIKPRPRCAEIMLHCIAVNHASIMHVIYAQRKRF
jgi:hypothetical protein